MNCRKGTIPGALCSSQGFGNSPVISLCTYTWLHPSHPTPMRAASNSAVAEHLCCWDRPLVHSEREVPSVAFHEKSIARQRGKYVVKVSLLCQAPAGTGSKRLPAPCYLASTLRQQLIQQLFEVAEKAPADSCLNKYWWKMASCRGSCPLNRRTFCMENGSMG